MRPRKKITRRPFARKRHESAATEHHAAACLCRSMIRLAERVGARYRHDSHAAYFMNIIGLVLVSSFGCHCAETYCAAQFDSELPEVGMGMKDADALPDSGIIRKMWAVEATRYRDHL